MTMTILQFIPVIRFKLPSKTVFNHYFDLFSLSLVAVVQSIVLFSIISIPHYY